MRREIFAAFSYCVLYLAVASPARAADTPPAPGPSGAAHRLPGIEVIGVTPLPGLGVPVNEVPASVQTLTDADLRRQHALNLTDYLDDNFSGINTNAIQNNPFQPDVTYHGFRASPLLGAPIGLSVYQDGVRVNESFGNTVNWDLIPESAISDVTLMSGSNPAFGLNTLGGALAVRTKDGRHNPGTKMQFYGGSFGRTDAQAQTGGTWGDFDYFLTGNYFHEDGWRAFSSSLVRQLFGKAGWQNADTSVHLSYTGANNDLIGNGVVPLSMLNRDRSSIYTSPDQTQNTLHFLNLTGSHGFTDTLLLTANVYYRDLKTRTLNGDDNDDFEDDDCDAVPGGLAGATRLDDIAVCAHGLARRSGIRQRAFGSGWELTESHALWSWRNQAALGIDFSRSLNAFSQTQQYQNLTAERAISPLASPFNPLLDVNGLSGHNQIYGAYVTDTLSPTAWLHLVAAARYNRNTLKLAGHTFDASTPLAPEPMTIDHNFNRINPALGFTVTPTRTLTFYADYNAGSRSPSLIELGCADPAAPCGLPNNFASDPDLKQVVARTFEVGARGSLWGKMLGWDVNLYHTRNTNDIQLIATNTSEGYFANIGATRHQGADLGLHGTLQHLTWHLSYSFTDATYQSSFQLNSGGNSRCVGASDDACTITARPGGRIPLIPRQTGRLALDYAVTEKWNVGLNVIVASGQYLTGNENNANQAGHTTGYGGDVEGSGRTGGYTVVNLSTNYRVAPNVTLFTRVDNLLDRDYATGGFLTASAFQPDGTWQNDGHDRVSENFVAPGPPITAWAGLRVRF